MAVTITDNRVIIDTADSTTGWTGTTTVSNRTDIFAEGTASVAIGLNIATGTLFFTTAAIDISNSLLYTRQFNQAVQLGWNDPIAPSALLLGDGTDQIAFHETGNDRDVFKHSETEVFFQSFLLDGSEAAAKDARGETTVIAGSFAALDLTNIVDIGGRFDTLSKALGGGQNCFLDIIRHDETGHRGVTITAGTPAAPGTFSDIAEGDRSIADLAGHGVLREYTPGIYGLQATLRFGANPGQNSDTFFVSNNEVLVFEDRDVADDKFWFYVQGAADNVVFYLQNCTVTTAGPEVRSFFSDAGINELDIQGTTFSGLSRTMAFANDPLNAPHHNVIGNTFNAVGMIDPGTVKFRDNLISNPADKLGGLLIDDDGTDNMSDLTFQSDGTGHGFYIHSPGSYTLQNWLYSGFGADATTDAAVFNDSNGAVTLTIAGGGDSPTVRNGSGSSTTIINAVTLLVTVLDTAGDPIANARVAIYENAETPTETELMNELTNGSGVATEPFNFLGDITVSVRIRKGSSTDVPKFIPVNTNQQVTSSGLTVTITMLEDTINNA